MVTGEEKARRAVARTRGRQPVSVHDSCQGQNWSGTRYMTCGYATVEIGIAADPSFTHLERGTLGAFRRQHFLVFLIAHFHKAALLMFSDRLADAVNRLDVRDARRRPEISCRYASCARDLLALYAPLDQAQHLFNMCRQHLEVDQLYRDARGGAGSTSRRKPRVDRTRR